MVIYAAPETLPPSAPVLFSDAPCFSFVRFENTKWKLYGNEDKMYRDADRIGDFNAAENVFSLMYGENMEIGSWAGWICIQAILSFLQLLEWHKCKC